MRYGAIVLVLILLAGFYFSRLPVPEAPPPAQGAVLEDIELTLYPEADPEAHWVFTAERVVQDPQTDLATVSGIGSGIRYVDGKVDLTLDAPEITIDYRDNLRALQAEVYIPRECWRVELYGEPNDPVLIDQRLGFRAQRMQLSGPGLEVTGVDFTSDFQLEEASWREGRESWQSGDVEECNETKT